MIDYVCVYLKQDKKKRQRNRLKANKSMKEKERVKASIAYTIVGINLS